MLAIGCDIGDELDPALSELARLRKQVEDAKETAEGISDDWETQSDKWRDEVKKWREGEGRLTEAAASFMENGMEDTVKNAEEAVKRSIEEMERASKETVQDAAAEVRLSTRYIEAKIKANLKAVGDAIDELESEMEEGDLSVEPEERFKALIKELAAEVPLTPATGTSIPREVDVHWNSPDKETGFAAKTTKVYVSGFGFRHPDWQKHARLSLTKGDKEAEDVSASLKVNSDYLLTIDLSDNVLAELLEADRLSLRWEEEDLHGIDVRWFRTPSLPPEKQIAVHWTHDGKVKEIKPPSWDFGMAPEFARLVRVDNSHFDVSADRKVDFSSLPLQVNDQGLEMTWKAQEILDKNQVKNVLRFRHTVDDPPPPPLPMITAFIIRMNTLNEDSDERSYVDFKILKANAVVYHNPDEGRGQDWDDGHRYEREIPGIQGVTYMQGDRFRVEITLMGDDQEWEAQIQLGIRIDNGQALFADLSPAFEYEDLQLIGGGRTFSHVFSF